MTAQSSRLRVYLVEDSTILGRLLIEMFRIEDGVLLVGRAKDAATAIDEINTIKPDVVVVDIALQSGTGFDVIRSFPERSDATRPTFFVLTNYAVGQFREAAQRLGVNHFFEKSTEIVKMFNVIRSLMQEKNDKPSDGEQQNESSSRPTAAKRLAAAVLAHTPATGPAGPTAAS